MSFLQPLNYDSGEPIWLISDASATGIGAVLSQGPDWKTAPPVAFESRGYQGDEEKKQGEWAYETHDKELLAIIHALKKWKHLLLGAKFTICTYHESIKYLMTKKGLSDRQARWANLLSEFEFDINYIKGVTNKVADALSRHPNNKPEETDPEINEIRESLFQQICEAANKDRKYWLMENMTDQFKELHYEDDILYHNDQVVIPDDDMLRERMMRNAHDQLSHPDFKRSLSQLKKYMLLGHDVKRYGTICQIL